MTTLFRDYVGHHAFKLVDNQSKYRAYTIYHDLKVEREQFEQTVMKWVGHLRGHEPKIMESINNSLPDFYLIWPFCTKQMENLIPTDIKAAVALAFNPARNSMDVVWSRGKVDGMWENVKSEAAYICTHCNDIKIFGCDTLVVRIPPTDASLVHDFEEMGFKQGPGDLMTTTFSNDEVESGDEEEDEDGEDNVIDYHLRATLNPVARDEHKFRCWEFFAEAFASTRDFHDFLARALGKEFVKSHPTHSTLYGVVVYIAVKSAESLGHDVTYVADATVALRETQKHKTMGIIFENLSQDQKRNKALLDLAHELIMYYCGDDLFEVVLDYNFEQVDRIDFLFEEDLVLKYKHPTSFVDYIIKYTAENKNFNGELYAAFEKVKLPTKRKLDVTASTPKKTKTATHNDGDTNSSSDGSEQF